MKLLQIFSLLGLVSSVVCLKSCYQKAAFTQYWIPKEGTKDMLNDGKVVTLTGPATYSLKTSSGKLIQKVSKITYQKFQMEGTGLLKSGKLVNVGDSDSEFVVLDQNKHPFGLGSDDKNIYPFVSVASNDLRQGTLLYIKALDGKTLPTGKKHNGCVRVDDVGDSFSGCQLDFFVLEYAYYEKLDLPEHVSVVQKSCKLLDYTTTAMDAWMGSTA
ncbi:hypothetical protein K450DRAFT_223505 [Umbelopsis ramanniana AG]|uniref:Uncharacterized protein n=1 Tax=Umbelopsis ramanniana AG TaxID=1314678 RepID=A0AAD5EHF5_UMBRA|nr:uncharacterized protein K450DRAFT_223505 [Umbelopsis ramanniana AG]KAI8583407.1 hypothetical protein K450DRAFT_223505 [Umbelopsis ramanniana AG]